MEFGKLSPLYVECKDGKPTLEQLGISDEEKNLLERLFNFEEKFTKKEQEKLKFLDKKLDIPLVEAIFNPSYKALKRLFDNECKNIPIPKKIYVEQIIENDHFEMAKWAIKNGVKCDEETCISAVQKGQLDILKLLREKGCPWDEYTCNHAILNGHFEILKWARENGCPWDEGACASAAETGNIEILKYLKQNGCPWYEYSCSLALNYGHHSTVTWILENRWGNNF